MESVNLSLLCFAVCLAFCKSSSVRMPSGTNLHNVTTTISYKKTNSNGANSNLISLRKYLVMRTGASVDVTSSNFEIEDGSFIRYEGNNQSHEISNSTIVLKNKSLLKQSFYSPKRVKSCFDNTSVALGTEAANLTHYLSNQTALVIESSVLHMDSTTVELGNSTTLFMYKATVNMKHSSMRGSSMISTSCVTSNIRLSGSTVSLGTMSVFDVAIDSTFVASHSTICIGANVSSILVLVNSRVDLAFSSIKLPPQSFVILNVDSRLSMVNGKLDFGPITTLTLSESVLNMNNSSITTRGANQFDRLGLYQSMISLDNSIIEMKDKSLVGMTSGGQLYAKNLHLRMDVGSELLMVGMITTDGPNNGNWKFHVGKDSIVAIRGIRSITGDVDIPPFTRVTDGYGTNFVCQNPTS